MFEKLMKEAERTATEVSRRQFLSRLGRAATVAAGGLGAMLAFPRDALAQGPRRCPSRCYYYKARCICPRA